MVRKKHLYNRNAVISKIEFARRTGVDPKRLSEFFHTVNAEVLNGKAVMVEHPLIKTMLSMPSLRVANGKVDGVDMTQFLERPLSPMRRTAKKNDKGNAKSPQIQSSDVGGGVDVDIDAIRHLTLDQVAESYGGGSGLKEYLAALKLIEEIKEKRLKNQDRLGDVVPRGLVLSLVFSHLEALNKRLLSDLPKTAATLARSSATLELAIEDIKAIVTKELQRVQATVGRNVQKLKGVEGTEDGPSVD